MAPQGIALGNGRSLITLREEIHSLPVGLEIAGSDRNLKIYQRREAQTQRVDNLLILKSSISRGAGGTEVGHVIGGGASLRRINFAADGGVDIVAAPLSGGNSYAHGAGFGLSASIGPIE